MLLIFLKVITILFFLQVLRPLFKVNNRLISLFIDFLQQVRHVFKLNNRLISLLIEFKRNLVNILPRIKIPEIKYHIEITLIVRGTS